MATLSMFNHSNNTTITGGTYTNVLSLKTPLEILRDNAAPGAFHDSEERHSAPKCHPETRVAVQRDIINHVLNAVMVCIIWLYGGAGVGKSAIAQSIASTSEEMDEQGSILLGSFFFFRASALRNNAKRLGASLAYQLAVAIPETLPSIADYMTSNPAIFERNLEKQLLSLFIQPLKDACNKSPSLKLRHRLLILDGLDECDTPNCQLHVLEVLAKILPLCPIHLVILVASRPEVYIQSAFAMIEREPKIKTVRIGLNDCHKADEDIRLFLDSKFSSIVLTHRFKQYLPQIWPDQKDVDLIVEKSSGHFIFAATIIRWAESHLHKPHERLRTALGAANRFARHVRDSPFKQLDALYFQIFSTLENPILSLAILYTRLRTDENALFRPEDIEFDLLLAPGDVELHLSYLASLIRVNHVDGRQDIEFFHASLHDFLFNQGRSLEFYIEQPAVMKVLCKNYGAHALDPEQRSYSWIKRLEQFRAHLASAEIDEELATCIGEIGGKVPWFLNELAHVPWDSFWESSGLIKPNLDRLVKTLTGIENIMRTKADNESYQICDNFMKVIGDFLARELSFFSGNQDNLDFLAVLAFANARLAPNESLSMVFSVSQECWIQWKNAHVLYDVGGRNIVAIPSSRCLKVLRKFLRDKAWSKELYIEDQAFVRLVHKCFTFLSPQSLSSSSHPLDSGDLNALFDYGPSARDPSMITTNYSWALKALTSMLALAPCDPLIIKALQKSGYGATFICPNDEYAVKATTAICSYVERHKSRAGSHNPSLKRLRDEVDEPGAKRTRNEPMRRLATEITQRSQSPLFVPSLALDVPDHLFELDQFLNQFIIRDFDPLGPLS